MTGEGEHRPYRHFRLTAQRHVPAQRQVPAQQARPKLPSAAGEEKSPEPEARGPSPGAGAGVSVGARAASYDSPATPAAAILRSGLWEM